MSYVCEARRMSELLESVGLLAPTIGELDSDWSPKLLYALEKLVAVAKAAREAADRIDSADNGWVLDDVRDALKGLVIK